MKAVVLVGGEGTRLRPLTYDTPKPLLPIANRAFLDRQLEWLAGHGIDEVVLSLGYLPDAFEAHFAAHPAPMRVRFAVEDDPLGTAGAIRFAAAGIDERVVVCNGDVLTTLDVSALVRFHEARGAEATIALTEVDDPSSFGVVPTGADGEVVAFVEKPTPGKAPTHWVNAGTYVLEPSVLDRIPPRLTVSVERETFPRMLAERGHLYAMQSDAYWIDIGAPEQYVRAHLEVLDGAMGAEPTADARELLPGVWAQGHVELDPDAVVVAPAVLGHGVIVDAGARIQASTLGDGVRVGPDARVIRSVLHRDAVIGRAVEITDSVIGAAAAVHDGAHVGARSIVGAQATVAAHARLASVRVAADEHEHPAPQES
ncbi:MAG TPA: NDP-sugar synthase [Acidimicrobiia bacterium]|nr:NDP-sugar synthase [Acidimicrobiia bacterium]